MRNKQLQSILENEAHNSTMSEEGYKLRLTALKQQFAPIDALLPFTMPAKYAVGDSVAVPKIKLPASTVLEVKFNADENGHMYGLYDAELDRLLWYFEHELEPPKRV